jgi:hypothetical protein
MRNTDIDRGTDVGGGGGAHTFCNQSNVRGIAVCPKLIRSSCVLTLMLVRVHVCHVLVDGVISLRSCRCTPTVLCENSTTRRAPSWKQGTDFDIGSVGIAPTSWLPSGENTQVLSKTYVTITNTIQLQNYTFRLSKHSH